MAYTTKERDDWVHPQNKARDLAEAILEANVKSIHIVLRAVSKALLNVQQDLKAKARGKVLPTETSEIDLPQLSVQENVWKTIYSTFQSCSTSQNLDSKALAGFLSIISKISHITPIVTNIISSWESKEGLDVVKQLNNSISVIQNGLSASMSAYSDFGASSSALEVLQCEGAGRAITVLLLSPVEDFQTAAKTLIGLAFDVDLRMECFRSMFSNLPSDTFTGIFQYLTTFSRYVSTVTEACSLSAMLVLCFADILEVLCASPDGLLHNSRFLDVDSDDGPASRMLQFWKLLSQSLSLIYQRTPTWAEQIDTPNMVAWMRDALILAREILAQWAVIENAATAYSKAPRMPVNVAGYLRLGHR